MFEKKHRTKLYGTVAFVAVLSALFSLVSIIKYFYTCNTTSGGGQRPTGRAAAPRNIKPTCIIGNDDDLSSVTVVRGKKK